MFKNNLKITLRNMFKYKGYSLLNITGLSVGIAICLMLFLWINDELSYDRFHSDSDRIYRSLWEGKYGENSWTTEMVPVPLAGTMVDEFPEVEIATQIYPGRFTLKMGEEYIRENEVLFVDENFFEVFKIESLAGELSSVANDPNAILITPEVVERYFGKDVDYEAVLNQMIRGNNGAARVVTGVVKPFPKQTHLPFEFLTSIKNLPHIEQRKTQWSSASVHTYFRLNEQASPLELESKIQAYVDANLVDQDLIDNGGYARFPFELITNIHLKPNLTYLWMFGLIAIFILALACINFINLATARSLTRAKEIGVRKVLGSNRQQLIQQFFGESTLFVLISIVLALVITQFSLPSFNVIADKQLELQLLNSAYTWGVLLALLLLTSFATGAIPAFILSSFAPIKAIKNEVVKAGGKNRLRQGLVVFQFCISSGLIIATLVVNNQLNFLQSKDLGFEKEQVLILRSARGLGSNYPAFLEQLQTLPNVQTVSSAQFLPGDEFDSTIFTPEQPSNYESTSLSYCHIDMNFASALGLEILQGRDFNPQLSTDSMAYLINEKAAEKLGWPDPVNKKLTYAGFAEGRVIGVVKNFNFNSLHEEIKPIVLRMGSFNLPNIFVRLSAGDPRSSIQSIQALWQNMASEVPFEFSFLDAEIQQLYEREERMSSIFLVFAILAIFIACLGLLGLASFIAQRRTKEIGIRKVLGASVLGIIGLLSKDFVKLVLIALVLSIPIAWYLLHNWLENFAYHVSVQWWVFLVSGILALGIAVLTVSFQSLKTATINPIYALRDE